jgi:penicillin-binding protein 1A
LQHPLEQDWQQNYPTYKLGGQEIAMAEYQTAAERAHSDDNAVSIANGLLLAAIAPAIPVASPFLIEFLQKPAMQAERSVNLAIFILAMMMITAVVSAYFCHLRRSYVFSARKVIVLRRMLGQSYGPTTLILPNGVLRALITHFQSDYFLVGVCKNATRILQLRPWLPRLLPTA